MWKIVTPKEENEDASTCTGAKINQTTDPKFSTKFKKRGINPIPPSPWHLHKAG
ncbi:MAG: hypothetical protein LBE64_12025 [Acinetobacter pittii]|jgi:hypothetical protein|nr:hypothetical protein [Acinetobacter pittii]